MGRAGRPAGNSLKMDPDPPPLTLSDPLLEDLLAFKGVAVLLWFVAFLLVERLVPAAPRPAVLAGLSPQLHRYARNLLLWAVNIALSLAIVLPVTVWASDHPLWMRPAWWPGSGWGLALDLLLLDLWLYWWHRINHEWRFLWRFHEVHHLDRFLDASSAVRFHFGEVALSAAVRATVIVLLSVPLASVLVFETLVLAAAIFHHSNLRLPHRLERTASRAIITPEVHWVHHHAVRHDTDSNYGTFVTLWDILFGTRNRRPRELGMAIGVEGQDERTLPALLVRPFRRGAR